ncbi:MAG: hypothetical protein V1725_06950 [archaeon]
MKPFDKKLMNFLYELTKLDKYYSDNELANKILLEGSKRVTSKTIRSWFRVLDKGCFDYYPYPQYEKFGLQLYILFADADEHVLINKIPYQYYVAKWYSFRDLKEVLVLAYLIPTGFEKEFGDLVKKEHALDNLRWYQLYKAGIPLALYNEFHRCINRDGSGKLHKPKNLEEQLSLLKHHYQHLPRPVLADIIKKNPFIIPVVFEYSRDHWHSKQVWKALQRKFGKETWTYVQKRKSQQEGLGLKRVQDTMKNLNTSNLFVQMRPVYSALEQANMFYFSICSFSNIDELIQLIRELLPLCIFIYIFPISENRAALQLVINGNFLGKAAVIFEQHVFLEQLLFLNFEKSFALWKRDIFKFKDYYHFNPFTKAWENFPIKGKRKKVCI